MLGMTDIGLFEKKYRIFPKTCRLSKKVDTEERNKYNAVEVTEIGISVSKNRAFLSKCGS